MRFHERVKMYEYKLNDTEDMIIEYILKNKPQVVKLSIQALADKFFTAPNTIVRLSKKIGYDGFSELKNSLKSELSNIDLISYENERYGYVLNIKKTLELIDYELLDRLTELLLKCKQVMFYTVGDNMDTCHACIKYMRLSSPNIVFPLHRHEVLYTMNALSTQDLVFLISLSGETSETLEIARLAKEKHLPVVSLTHFSENTLQSLSDYHLYCYSPQVRLQGYNVTDVTPITIVLRALTELIWKKRGHEPIPTKPHQ